MEKKYQTRTLLMRPQYHDGAAEAHRFKNTETNLETSLSQPKRPQTNINKSQRCSIDI